MYNKNEKCRRKGDMVTHISIKGISVFLCSIFFCKNRVTFNRDRRKMLCEELAAAVGPQAASPGSQPRGLWPGSSELCVCSSHCKAGSGGLWARLLFGKSEPFALRQRCLQFQSSGGAKCPLGKGTSDLRALGEGD